jgi:hypothetical protein
MVEKTSGCTVVFNKSKTDAKVTHTGFSVNLLEISTLKPITLFSPLSNLPKESPPTAKNRYFTAETRKSPTIFLMTNRSNTCNICIS